MMMLNLGMAVSICCVSGVHDENLDLPNRSSIRQPSISSACRCQQAHVEDASRFGRRDILLSCLTTAAASACGEHFLSLAGIAAYNSTIENVKEIIENDIRNGQYYITGNLTRAIYDDNCRFTDPTTDISGVDKYVAAIKLLFDPKSSHHELISIAVTGPETIQANWRLEGYLKVPWHPHILPYEGTTQYRVNNNGLIVSHEETWDLSVWTAFFQFFTPSWKPL